MTLKYHKKQYHRDDFFSISMISAACLKNIPRCRDGQARQEGVQGGFGLVFGLKMRGFMYFDSTMFIEPYFSLINVIARNATSQLQF